MTIKTVIRTNSASCYPSAVSRRLDAVQVGVAAVAGKQFLVAARLRDAGAVEHHDEVGHPDRAEPVRDQDGHAPVLPRLPGGGGVALEQLVLGLRVERRRRLVERHEQRFVAHEPAGKCELLPLAVGLALRRSADTDLRLRAEIESLLGNIAAERGEAVEAKAEAESHHRAAARLFETLRDTPAVASQLAAIGQLLILQRRPEEALEEFRAAIDRMPGDPVIQTDLALALWRLGESEAAVTVLTSVLALDGGNTVALRARGEILAELGRARQAMLDLDRVTLAERPATRAARGLALAKLGDRSAADLEVDDAVAEAPWNGSVLLHAARAKALNGEEDAAEELARRAVDATDPGLPPYHREVALQLAGHKHGKSTVKLVPAVISWRGRECGRGPASPRAAAGQAPAGRT
jgi:tetratricopeptide (TPR) repeat protein